MQFGVSFRFEGIRMSEGGWVFNAPAPFGRNWFHSSYITQD